MCCMPVTAQNRDIEIRLGSVTLAYHELDTCWTIILVEHLAILIVPSLEWHSWRPACMLLCSVCEYVDGKRAKIDKVLCLLRLRYDWWCGDKFERTLSSLRMTFVRELFPMPAGLINPICSSLATRFVTTTRSSWSHNMAGRNGGSVRRYLFVFREYAQPDKMATYFGTLILVVLSPQTSLSTLIAMRVITLSLISAANSKWWERRASTKIIAPALRLLHYSWN